MSVNFIKKTLTGLEIAKSVVLIILVEALASACWCFNFGVRNIKIC